MASTTRIVVDPATLSDPNIRLSAAQKEVMLAIVNARGMLDVAVNRKKLFSVGDEDFDPVRDEKEAKDADAQLKIAKEFLACEVSRLNELEEYEREQLKLGLERAGVVYVIET